MDDREWKEQAKAVRRLLLEQQEQLRVDLREQQAWLRKQFERDQRSLERLKQAAPRVSAVGVLEGIRDFLHDFARVVEEETPTNWRDLTIEQWEAVISLIEETGWCLVWVPRQDIVRELIDAEPAQRGATLLANHAEVLNDLRSCLNETGTPSTDLKTQVAAAIEAFDAGHWRAAQALTAVLLTTVLEQTLGFGRLRNAREALEPLDPEDVSFRLFRFATIASVLDFASYWDPPEGPAGFSRNRSVHHADDPIQYTEINGLASLMLLVALLREAEYWYVEDVERGRLPGQPV